MSAKRWLRFEYADGAFTDIEIGKVTLLKIEKSKVRFHVDMTQDGTHLLVCDEKLMPEGKQLDCIRVVREEHGADKREEQDLSPEQYSAMCSVLAKRVKWPGPPAT